MQKSHDEIYELEMGREILIIPAQSNVDTSKLDSSIGTIIVFEGFMKPYPDSLLLSYQLGGCL